MDHALADFHQVEVFLLMNWIDSPIDPFGLSWYNNMCLNSTWASDTKTTGKHQCMGSKPQATTQKRLHHLTDFLEEVKDKGFWDQHITPMSYIISSNKFYIRARYLDIENIDWLKELVVTSSGKVSKRFSSMKRGNSDLGMDWVVRWDELVTLARKYALARLAIKKLCHLYQSDVTCLPYDVPECDRMGT